MKPKMEILQAYKITPQQYSSMAMTYSLLPEDVRNKFKRVTNDIVLSATDLTEEEARTISTIDMDARTIGDKMFLIPKARKRLLELL